MFGYRESWLIIFSKPFFSVEGSLCVGVFKPVDISWNKCSQESVLGDAGLHLEAFRFECSLEEKKTGEQMYCALKIGTCEVQLPEELSFLLSLSFAFGNLRNGCELL